MKQTTLTKKQENRAVRGILDLTGQQSQVLKQFEGIYACELPETDGQTVESFMEYYGVPRFTKVDAKGRITKKGYTPGLIAAAWDDSLLIKSSDGKVFGSCVYKNVSAKYMMMNDEGHEKAYRVYASEEEALSEDAKGIKLYMPVEVDKCKWSVRTVLTGLKQSHNIKAEQDKAAKTQEEWEKVETCWIVINSGSVRIAKQVDKKSVVF